MAVCVLKDAGAVGRLTGAKRLINAWRLIYAIADGLGRTVCCPVSGRQSWKWKAQSMRRDPTPRRVMLTAMCGKLSGGMRTKRSKLRGQRHLMHTLEE